MRVPVMMLVGTIGACLAVPTAHAAEPDEILERADEVRSPAQSYRMTVEVESWAGGDSTAQVSAFEVMIQGRDKTLIRTFKPARDRGRNLLMLGDDMWAYIPNLKRAVRVSLSQKLIGQAANGDLSRMGWRGDYDAVVESEDDAVWVLFLTAKRKGLTYDKIRVRVAKENFRPLSAEYLGVSAKLLKRVEYDDYRMLAGAVRPGEIRIHDALKASDRSTIHIREMQTQKFAEALFQQSNLGRVE